MPEIKFSSEKAGRWLDRVEKRLSRLSPDDVTMYNQILTKHRAGEKLDHLHSKALWELERKL
jgi:hypothetical protein